MSIINHDFGKQDRKTVQRFARLLKIVEEQEADILKDPIKHLRIAGDEIARCHLFIRDLIDLTHRPVSDWLRRDIRPPFDDTVRMLKSEYDRLKAVESKLAEWDKPTRPAPERE